MWNEAKRQRFSALRERDKSGSLTPEEKAELEEAYRQLEEMEASYLGPVTERKRAETAKLRALNAALRDVIRRKEERLAQMKAAFAKWRVESEELDAELERLLSQTAPAESSATG